MPCHDFGPSAPQNGYRRNDDKVYERLDNVTRLLCKLCLTVELFGQGTHHDYLAGLPDVKTWWVEHKKQDAAEKARKANPNWHNEESK